MEKIIENDVSITMPKMQKQDEIPILKAYFWKKQEKVRLLRKEFFC